MREYNFTNYLVNDMDHLSLVVYSSTFLISLIESSPRNYVDGCIYSTFSLLKSSCHVLTSSGFMDNITYLNADSFSSDNFTDAIYQ